MRYMHSCVLHGTKSIYAMYVVTVHAALTSTIVSFALPVSTTIPAILGACCEGGTIQPRSPVPHNTHTHTHTHTHIPCFTVHCLYARVQEWLNAGVFVCVCVCVCVCMCVCVSTDLYQTIRPPL